MTEATITIDESNGIKIARVSGQLDESNVDEKIKDFYKVIEENPKGLKLVLDLANLDYMNSKSIGYLTDLYGKITESGGQIAIANAKPNITDILQVVGITQLIKTYASINEAKTALSAVTQPQQTPNTSANTSAPTNPTQ